MLGGMALRVNKGVPGTRASGVAVIAQKADSAAWWIRTFPHLLKQLRDRANLVVVKLDRFRQPGQLAGSVDDEVQLQPLSRTMSLRTSRAYRRTPAATSSTAEGREHAAKLSTACCINPIWIDAQRAFAGCGLVNS